MESKIKIVNLNNDVPQTIKTLDYGDYFLYNGVLYRKTYNIGYDDEDYLLMRISDGKFVSIGKDDPVTRVNVYIECKAK